MKTVMRVIFFIDLIYFFSFLKKLFFYKWFNCKCLKYYFIENVNLICFIEVFIVLLFWILGYKVILYVFRLK